MPRRIIDWDAIEREYSLGIRSNLDIAQQFELSEGAIRKKAKQMEWTKDLSAKIKLKTQEKVRKSEYESSTIAKLSDKDAIDIAATTQANIVLAHRSDIRRYKSLGESLLQELELQTGAIVTLEELGEMMRSPDEKGVDKLNDIYKKAISTPSRIDSFKKAVETLKNIVGLERQAFGISDNANGEANKTNTDDAITQAMHAARARVINH